MLFVIPMNVRLFTDLFMSWFRDLRQLEAIAVSFRRRQGEQTIFICANQHKPITRTTSRGEVLESLV